VKPLSVLRYVYNHLLSDGGIAFLRHIPLPALGINRMSIPMLTAHFLQTSQQIFFFPTVDSPDNYSCLMKKSNDHPTMPNFFNYDGKLREVGGRESYSYATLTLTNEWQNKLSGVEKEQVNNADMIEHFLGISLVKMPLISYKPKN
jgi:hypothetical protein